MQGNTFSPSKNYGQRTGALLSSAVRVNAGGVFTLPLWMRICLNHLKKKTEATFLNGNGFELQGNPAKMQALHSSSALAVNFFQFWQKRKLVPVIAAACGLCRKGNTTSQSVVFEEKFPIHSTLTTPPNLDVVIHNAEDNPCKVFAIECKFSEAYSNRKDGHGLREQYLQLKEIWSGIPHLQEFAKSLSPEDATFQYLHPAQLVKHILGLKNAFGKKGFRLMYLWYDVPGEEGYFHRKEAEQLVRICKTDGILFHARTYQEVIMSLAKEKGEEINHFLSYVATRYL